MPDTIYVYLFLFLAENKLYLQSIRDTQFRAQLQKQKLFVLRQWTLKERRF